VRLGVFGFWVFCGWFQVRWTSSPGVRFSSVYVMVSIVGVGFVFVNVYSRHSMQVPIFWCFSQSYCMGPGLFWNSSTIWSASWRLIVAIPLPPNEVTDINHPVLLSLGKMFSLWVIPLDVKVGCLSLLFFMFCFFYCAGM
jgi:hypothetical protein